MQTVLRDVLQGSPNQEKTCSFVSRWQSVHELFLRTLNDNWRRYINYLDEEVWKIFNQVILSDVDPNTSEERRFVENALANVKRLQYLIDRATRVCHMLDLNIMTMTALIKFSGAISRDDTFSTATSKSSFDEECQHIMEESQVHLKTASSLLARANSLSPHLRDVIAMRNNEFMKMMTVSTVQGNEALLALSQKSIDEARSMKVVTMVALDFLQMGYISTREGEKFGMSASKGLLIYAIIAVPLVLVTMGVYLFFELFNQTIRRSRKKQTVVEKQAAIA
ncbi:hypothetical protein ACLMJK_003067 [Lecanora helva]